MSASSDPYHGRAAGLRTYALVCLGSALLVALAEELSHGPAGGPGDSTRVIQGIVTGIGFVGAGVIVKEGFSVRGLTTAASVWVISAVGVVIGAGFYVLGAAACTDAGFAFRFFDPWRIGSIRKPSSIAIFPSAATRSATRIGCASLFPSTVFRSPIFPIDSTAGPHRLNTGLSCGPPSPGRVRQASARIRWRCPSVVDFRISPSRD